jgi:hypothetical protein
LNNKILKLLLTCIAFLTLHYIAYSQQVTLQPWTQVFGTVPGQRLGNNVAYLGKYLDTIRVAIATDSIVKILYLKTPLDTTPRYVFPGNHAQIGDFNGDGIEDLLVGGDSIRIYLGQAGGRFDTAAFFVKHAETPLDGFGIFTAVGDINGDGKDDILMSAPAFPAYGVPADSDYGKVYVFFGRTVMDTVPSFTLPGSRTKSYLGSNVALGDVNGDGKLDLCILGFDYHDIKANRFKYIQVHLGGDTISTVPWFYERGDVNAQSGLACFDVNGDGIADLLWTDRDSSDFVSIHYGGAIIDSFPNLTLKNPGVSSFGNVIGNSGDMNGDGYNDIVVGAYGATITSGFVFVFGGGPRINSNFDAAIGMSSDSFFGYSVASIGDINGDGLADIIVGAPGYEFEDYKGYWGIFKGDTSIKVNVVIENGLLPKVFDLYQSYPNPFNPRTTISYDLKESGEVTLEITNLTGQHIITLIDEKEYSGTHQVFFDGSEYSSGTYFYTLIVRTTNGQTFTDTKKLTLIK